MINKKTYSDKNKLYLKLNITNAEGIKELHFVNSGTKF